MLVRFVKFEIGMRTNKLQMERILLTLDWRVIIHIIGILSRILFITR